MSETKRFSNSGFKVFQDCLRKYWLSEVRGLGPKGFSPTGPLRTGSRLHDALEAFYTPGADPAAVLHAAQVSDWNAYLDTLENPDTDGDGALYDAFRKDCDLERAMLEGYGEWIAETGADAGLTTIATEQIISVPGSAFAPELVERYGDFAVVGKLDERVERKADGARMFKDHKTAQSLILKLPALQQDPQMLHYMWLESMTEDGGWCDGAIYNVLKKVKRTKTATPPFFARYEIYHNDEEVSNYETRMKYLIADMFEFERRLAEASSDAERAQIARPHATDDCSWKCPFFKACPSFDDGSRVEAMLADQFEERDPLARYAEPKGQGV